MATARPPDPDRNPGSGLVGAGFGRDRRDGPGLAAIAARGGPWPSAALRLNELVQASVPTDGAAKVVVEQATAQINQTSKERSAAAQTMLEKALGDHPDNVDIHVALAALQLRGIQMVWYSPADAAAAEKNAKAMLERALRTRPVSIPVLQAYCRFLNATNEFTESLVACARTLGSTPGTEWRCTTSAWRSFHWAGSRRAWRRSSRRIGLIRRRCRAGPGCLARE